MSETSENKTETGGDTSSGDDLDRAPASGVPTEQPETESEAPPEPEVEAETKPAPEPEAKPIRIDWKDRRIAELTAKNARLAQQVAQPGTSETPPTETVPAPGSAEFAAAVEAAASARAEAQAFNVACNAAAQAGRKVFGETEFNSRVKELAQLVDPKDPDSVTKYNQFLAAALETGDAPRLLFDLGSDLDEASRVMGLPPLKMAVELTKLAAKTKAVPEPSKASKPITPVGNRGVALSDIDPTDPLRADKLSTNEWVRRMDERDRKLAKAGT